VLDLHGIVIQVLREARDISFLQSLQTTSVGHPAFYSVGIGDPSPEVK